MAVYAKGNKWMASVGAGATRVRKTFPTEAAAKEWEQAEEDARAPRKGRESRACSGAYYPARVDHTAGLR